MKYLSERSAWTEAIQLLLGVVLFVTPWVVGFAAEQNPAWTAWLTGVVIALIATVGLAGYAYYAAYANVAIGLWAIIAPWLIGFSANTGALWSHVIVGAAVAVAAAVELWTGHDTSSRVHA
jgi:SPW repeat